MMRPTLQTYDLDNATDNLSKGLGGTSPVVGIDLGTSNSCACIVINGSPVVIEVPDEDGSLHRTIPSVVSYDARGGAQVGKRALLGLAEAPKRTVFGAKRFIGRDYESPAVQEMLSRFPYRVVPGGLGKVAVDVDGKRINLTSISARILQQLKRAVSQRLGHEVSRAVITVPAFYNDNQRQAVVIAGRLAGLQVERVINEPTAAAIAYGLHRSRARRLVVYDLGGGTFDVSVMAVDRDSLTVKATAGDTFLGGEDFDNAIVDYVYETYRSAGGPLLSTSATARGRIRKAAESTKRRLSIHERSMVTVRDALTLDGQSVRLEIPLDRRTLNRLVKPFIDRTLRITEQALNDAKMDRRNIRDVILVGGQTRMPAVAQAVAAHFGCVPRSDINPDEVVAVGAGLLAGMSPQQSSKFRDVLSMTIGIEQGRKFKPILARNTAVPARKVLSMKVPRERFHRFGLQLFQGESPELHRNELLGSVRVDHLAPGELDPIPMHVELALTADCLLQVTVRNESTGHAAQVILNTRDA